MDDVALPEYVVRRVGSSVGPLRWDDPAWAAADTCSVAHFHPASSDHRPGVTARLAFDGAALHLRFDVADDRFVLARATADQQPVWRDSCVEWFVQPRAGGPYVNLEFNCGGTRLASAIADPARTADGTFARWYPLPAVDLDAVAVRATLPRIVDPEQPGPVTWHLSARVPLAVLDAHVGPVDVRPGARWRGNFHKCADDSSHPHWASWSPIGPALNFHQPDRFAWLRLQG